MCHNVTKNPIENAEDKIFQELRPDVKVNETMPWKQKTAIYDTKFGIPALNNIAKQIRYILVYAQETIFLVLRPEVKVT